MKMNKKIFAIAIINLFLMSAIVIIPVSGKSDTTNIDFDKNNPGDIQQSEIGSQFVIQFLDVWTYPEYVMPGQKAELWFKVKNIGPDTAYNLECDFYIDGKYHNNFFIPNPPRIIHVYVTIQKLEVGQTWSDCFPKYWTNWPNDFDVHEIKYKIDRYTECLYKSASENLPPEKPEKPTGETQGTNDTIYYYSTKGTDPNAHNLDYKWDWGDGTFSDWLGPYESGVTVSGNHSWNTEDTYQIRVKTKDELGLESPWSDSLEIDIDNGDDDGYVNFNQNLGMQNL